MTITAYGALSKGSPLTLFPYPVPHLREHEVLVKISHSGLCHTDLFMIDNDWGRSTYPLVPGHEIVGTVVEAHSSQNSLLHQRVGVSWVKSACLKCPLCLEGDTNLCPEKVGCYNKGSFGGFATHIVADGRFVYPIPDGLKSAQAAPLLCAGATCFAPFRRFKIQAPDHVAVLGIGGLGHLALQIAKAFGCEVTALSSTAEKRKEALSFGADHFHLLSEMLPPSRFHFILCTTDADLDWSYFLTLLKPNGTLCFVSRPPKGARLDFGHLVSTQRAIVGSNNANRAHMNEMLAFCSRKKIAPQIEVMPLTQINEGIERLKQGKVRYRIVFEVV